MMDTNFDAFRARKLKEGFDQVLERVWAPHFSNEPHDHPFDTDAIVAQGEYWLTLGGQTLHLKVGDRFEVPRARVYPLCI